jgi:hypothetical protein
MKWGKSQSKSEISEHPEVVEDGERIEADVVAEIEYELHEWAGETRLVLDQLLILKEVPHVWQGATLVIREEDEEAADQLIEEAESTSLPTLEPDAETIEYEITGWSDSEQTSFSALLVRFGIPHEFNDEGGLVAQASDEEAIETALDAFQVVSDERPELDGLDANSLLTEVFVACDRLRRDYRDDVGVGEILRLTPVLVEHRPPFGIEANQWDEIGKRAIGLVDLLSEGSGDEEEITLQASGFAEILRSMT